MSPQVAILLCAVISQGLWHSPVLSLLVSPCSPASHPQTYFSQSAVGLERASFSWRHAARGFCACSSRAQRPSLLIPEFGTRLWKWGGAGSQSLQFSGVFLALTRSESHPLGKIHISPYKDIIGYGIITCVMRPVSFISRPPFTRSHCSDFYFTKYLTVSGATSAFLPWTPVGNQPVLPDVPLCSLDGRERPTQGQSKGLAIQLLSTCEGVLATFITYVISSLMTFCPMRLCALSSNK